MQLNGRTALVTGASSGIGAELARRLARSGADPILVARRTDRLDTLAAELTRAHPDRRVRVPAAGLAEPGAGADLARRVADAGLTVDVLVNNAGIGAHDAFVDSDPADVARLIALNVGALVDLTGRFLPGMVHRGLGAVVNLGSTASFQPVPTMAVYGATKAFVWSFTEALWYETRGTGVRVVALCPGATETAFYARTGKEFLTRGRQTAAQVADTALRALDGSAPTVVSGWRNRLGAQGYRLMPRRLLIALSRTVVRPTP